MKLTRILCALLAMLMLLSCMSCDKQPPNEEDPPVQEGDDNKEPEQQNKNVLSIIKDGVSEYALIRSENAKSGVRTVFSSLNEAILAQTGTKLKIDTDWAEKSDKEILIGNTNREESAKALQDLQDMLILEELVGDGFMIRVKKGKVIIVGTNDEATVRGVEYFIENYLK